MAKLDFCGRGKSPLSKKKKAQNTNSSLGGETNSTKRREGEIHSTIYRFNDDPPAHEVKKMRPPPKMPPTPKMLVLVLVLVLLKRNKVLFTQSYFVMR